MKAWQLTSTDGIDSYSLNEIPEPEPGPGELRIQIKYSALNHLDLWVARGLPPPKTFPHTGGADGAGLVDAIGDGVSGFELGDEIIIDPSMSCGRCVYCRNDEIVYCANYEILGEHRGGTFTEKIVIPTINAVRKPAGVPWEVAGSFGLAGVTAFRLLEKTAVHRNDVVLIVGIGGGVSAALLGYALALGAVVYVTSRSPEKIEWAIEQGATGGFDSGVEFGKEMSDLGGADVVFDNVGPATLKQSMRAAKPGGKIGISGSTSGPQVELTIPHLFFRHLELVGSSMGNHGQFARATNWISLGKAVPQVDRIYDFDQLPDALHYLDSGDQMGKVVVRQPASSI